MTPIPRRACAFLLAALGLAGPVAAQGVDPCGGPCETEGGSYRIALPEGPAPEGGHPALLFFHGAGRTGDDVVGRGDVVATMTGAGVAVIAPDGRGRDGGRGGGWSFRPAATPPEGRRDDVEFAAEVIADAAARHGIDPDRIAIGGYSIGGSMAWTVACRRPDLAQVFVPVAGAFWEPQPDPADCAGPVRMLHTHGWRDTTVPLEGRPLRDGAIFQGDVFAALRVLRFVNGCDARRADGFDTEGGLWRRSWDTCDEGGDMSLDLHPGAHVVPEGWAARVLDWWGLR